jgi:hypothetical protein
MSQNASFPDSLQPSAYPPELRKKFHIRPAGSALGVQGEEVFQERGKKEISCFYDFF